MMECGECFHVRNVHTVISNGIGRRKVGIHPFSENVPFSVTQDSFFDREFGMAALHQHLKASGISSIGQSYPH